MFNLKQIGKRIQKERKACGYKSLDDLADKVGTTRQTLSKWEKGDGSSSPSLWDIIRLCELFSCDFGYLVGEYDCKRRTSTDIRSLTGLSEEAANKLQALSSQEKQLIDDLLNNAEYLAGIAEAYCQYRDTLNRFNRLSSDLSSEMGLTTFSGYFSIEQGGKKSTIPVSKIKDFLQFSLIHETINFAERKEAE